jgi:hypothetical protein
VALCANGVRLASAILARRHAGVMQIPSPTIENFIEELDSLVDGGQIDENLIWNSIGIQVTIYWDQCGREQAKRWRGYAPDETHPCYCEYYERLIARTNKISNRMGDAFPTGSDPMVDQFLKAEQDGGGD